MMESIASLPLWLLCKSVVLVQSYVKSGLVDNYTYPFAKRRSDPTNSTRCHDYKIMVISSGQAKVWKNKSFGYQIYYTSGQVEPANPKFRHRLCLVSSEH